MIFSKGYKGQLIFLIAVFGFLFFSSEVFASFSCPTCKVETFSVSINYADPCPIPGQCSGLAGCEYKVVSNGITTINWTSTQNCVPACSGSSCSCSQSISVGSGQNCQHSGLGACIIYSKAIDSAGNSGENSTTTDICIGCLIGGVCYDNGEYNPTNKCQKCDRISSKTVWSNVTDGTDLGGQCAPTWTTCEGLGSPYKCQRKGGDGNCYAGVCDTNHRIGNITSGYVCTGSGTETTGSNTYYASVSTYNKCGGVGAPYSCQKGRDKLACDGFGGIAGPDVGDDWTSVGAGKVCSAGNEVSASAVYYCGFSSYNGRSADKCDKKKDYLACNGSNVCSYGDYGDAFDSVSAYKIANTSGQEIDASLADNTGTCHACAEGFCAGTYHWGECDGSGSVGLCSTYNQPQTVYAQIGYTLTSACGTNGSTLCGYSDWNGCSGNNCQAKRDTFRCDASHNCAYDVGDDLQNCASNSACLGGTCSLINLCDATWRSSLGSGDNNYGVSGNYVCQGRCDGTTNCDYAVNCDAKPVCDIKLRQQGTTNPITEVNPGQTFDIYTGDSTDDVGITGVRYCSDDSPGDGICNSTWNPAMGYYDWAVVANRTKPWSFATPGSKGVFTEVIDGKSQTSQCSSNIYVNFAPVCSWEVDRTEGYAPVGVGFMGYGNDTDGTIIQYEFDFGDGSAKVYCPDNPSCVCSPGLWCIIGYVYNTAGNYCAKLRVKDNDGVWSSAPAGCPGTCAQQITVNEDDVPPNVWIEANPSSVTSAWQNTDATATVKCSDTLSGCYGYTETYNIKKYDSDPVNCPQDYSAYTLTNPQIITSHQWVCGRASDVAGNVGYSTPVEFKIDKTKPPKPTCSPGSGNYADSVTVTCSDTEPGVTIRYTTNGSSPVPSSSQYTSALTFDITTTLTVAAWDQANNRSASPDNNYAYTIGNLPDTIIDSNPSNPTNQTSASFTFHGTNSPTSFQCKLDTGNWSVCTSPKPYTVSQGSHTFNVKAVNTFGEDPTPATFNWLVDTTAPTVDSFAADRNILNIANPTVTFTWEVSDEGGSGLKQIELWRRAVGQSWPDSPIDTASVSGNSDSGTFQDTPTANGNYEYGIHVLDNVDNMGTEFSAIAVAVDKTKPSSTIYRWGGSAWDTPDTGGNWQKAQFTRRSYDSDTGLGLDKCYFYAYDNIAGTSYSGVIQRTCSILLYDINVTVGASAYCRNQAEDGCSLYVYSIDKAGNQSDYGVVSYHIDYTPPTVGMTSPIAASQGVPQTFSADVSDNLKLNYCWLYVDGVSKGSMTISPSPCQNGSPCTASMSYTFPTSGIHQMYARCADHYDAQTASYLNLTSGTSVNVNVAVNNLPVITSGPSYTTSPCASPTTQTGCFVHFSVEAKDDDGDNLTFTWNFGDGNSISSTTTPPYPKTATSSHHYITAGTYPVIITVSDERGGATSSGINVPVTAPTLYAELSADPSIGVGSLSGVDLTATATGTMTGTINYKFYCTSSGPLMLETGATTINPYTAVDLCNYPSIGNYIAKVIVERGTGSAQATTSISVVSNQPPTCQISVLDRTTISTPISIGVGGSSDPEGALSGVRFSSDNNLNGLPNGSWNPAGGIYYDWNNSSSSWNAINKTMAWSFAATGTYEVWAQVKDNVSQAASCFDTIVVTECLSGDSKSCTSAQGCSHIIACQTNGTWPVCPTDQCSPGDPPQSCGTAGSQTCTVSCVWGACVEPGCPPSPPICPTCQQAVCSGGAWSCQLAPEGTDCGSCRTCNALGECEFQCSGTESSCECFSDTCVDCSNYYDPSGPTYGYQGVCHCGSLQIPVWACSGGSCSCVCWNPSEPPPSPPYVPPPDPPSPPSPPLGECARAYPDVYLSPTPQAGTAGQQLNYTVSVRNNDTNCDDSVFSLTKSCPTVPAGWTCSLDATSLTISPGYSKSTTLRVTSPLSAIKDDYPISATASSTYFKIEGYGTYQVANNPPTSASACHPQGCLQPSGVCSAYTWSNFCLKNNSSDIDGVSDIKNSIWTITGTMSDISNCLAVSGNPICNWSLPSNFTAGTYSAQLYVEDKAGATSTAYKPFTVLQDAIAEFDCSLASEGSWQECDTLRASEGEVVYFRNKSIASDGAVFTSGSWSWTFEDATPTASSLQHPLASFQVVDAGSGQVTLTVVDSNSRTDNTTHQIWITKPLPQWQEAPPF